ncbi:MAG: BREX system serine/threonine kinase PglW [Planctomycetota bacterium]
MASAKNWVSVTQSSFPWEREALDFVRGRFPTHEPYRGWSNFEFIADDGTINEVDLLVFTPQGFFLIEIKGRPGRLFGDAGTWTWEKDGKLTTVDNPLVLANAKAKKLRSLLQRQKVCKKKGPLPFIEALVFCSETDLQCQLQDTAAYRVCLRDREAQGSSPARPGIMAALTRRECPGLDSRPKGPHDKPTAKVVSQALEQAGIRPSQRYRKVSDYTLNQLIGEGPGYQDWQASHVKLPDFKRRVRIYTVRTGATEDERRTTERAAEREAQLLESLQHPGVLRREGFTEHELGPALIFEHDPQAIPLNHYLAQQKDDLPVDVRIDLLRQVAEVVRFAHDKKVIHRGLCPQSILAIPSPGGRPRIKVFNWQAGYRLASSTSGVSREVTATSHVDRLVEDASTAYMAPEASDEANHGEHLDVFSLGAIGYFLFSGSAPAANGVELSEKLRGTTGLQISSVLNGAGEWLQMLVQEATHPVVANRTDSVADFLSVLDEVEEELTAPEQDYVDDPTRAQRGDILPGGFHVLKRLGQGACSLGLLVEKDDEEFVLKVASEPDHNARLKDEAEVLGKLRHQHIVEFCGAVEMGDRQAFLMRPVLVQVTVNDRTEKRVETLGQRLRKEGRLSVDLLQRFGRDLLDVVNYLEEQGISHRDIKPDNIAVGQVGRGSKMHLILFDFSLSRTSAENIRAGTTGYLDPMLPLRKPPRWDLHAERYAAAVTLYELATGPNNLPRWGDGTTAPSHLDCEATIEPEAFDAPLRDAFTEFFQCCFRRNPSERFDNAEAMRDAWRECFVGIDQPGTLSDHEDEDELRRLLADATFDTQIPELGLGTRATNALDRANLLTVEDLLTVPMRRLLRLRGVGHKTRREISSAVKILRERLGSPKREDVTTVEPPDTNTDETDVTNLSVDLIAQRISRTGSREGETARGTLMMLLGLGESIQRPAVSGQPELIADKLNAEGSPWPSQSEIASALDVTRGRIGQLVGQFQGRWAKEPAVTGLRTSIAEILDGAGGVMTAPELAEAILVARGSIEDEPQRSRLAVAVTRAAVEVERTMAEPRFMVRRVGVSVVSRQLSAVSNHLGSLSGQAMAVSGQQSAISGKEEADSRSLNADSLPRVLIALSSGLATYAEQLGRAADRLADEDPLVPPARVIGRLREIALPTGAPVLSDTRLIRLAAAASEHAALSSRQELYPRGMDGARALRLSQGALYGVAFLTVAQIRQRVASRYPEAAPLPDPPALDGLLRDAGFSFQWDPAGKEGVGCYVSPLRETVSVTSGSETISRHSTAVRPMEGGDITPEVADARQFEERLQRGLKDGSFLALLVHPKHYQRAAKELSSRFDIELVDFEGLFIDELRQVAGAANVNWDLVLKTDAAPNQGDWDRLMMLVGRAMPRVESSVVSCQSSEAAEGGGVLLTYVGLLARYDQMTLLERLREKVERGRELRSCWSLLPGDQQALIDGKPVPLIGPGQKVRIPESWLQNVHRGDAAKLTQRREGASEGDDS